MEKYKWVLVIKLVNVAEAKRQNNRYKIWTIRILISNFNLKINIKIYVIKMDKF